MYLHWRRADPLTRKVLKLFFIGSGVKFLGYIIVTAGIFMGLSDREIGIRMIAIGVLVVTVGWLIIYKAYRVSKL